MKQNPAYVNEKNYTSNLCQGDGVVDTKECMATCQKNYKTIVDNLKITY